MKRKWDVSSNEVRRRCVSEVITRIQEQDGAEFGVIAANDIINIVLQNLSPDIYNMALEDVRKLLAEKLEDTQISLDLLKSSG